MITILRTKDKRLTPITLEEWQASERDSHAYWISVSSPSSDEINRIEESLGVSIPKPDEMQDLEVSENLYMQDGNLYMTAMMLTGTDTHTPQNQAITFIITPHNIVSFSYTEFKSIAALRSGNFTELSAESVDGILIYILEAMVGRLSDLLNNVGRRSDQLSQAVFRGEKTGQPEGLDFTTILKTVGSAYDIISYISESLVSFYRLLGFARRHVDVTRNQDVAHDLDSLSMDITALKEQASFESSKLMFMLDATLGLISIEQNGTIKIFSVLAVVLMPPTLVASIYGMNFKLMPELDWIMGYPMALLVMLFSAVGTYSYFRYKKWL